MKNSKAIYHLVRTKVNGTITGILTNKPSDTKKINTKPSTLIKKKRFGIFTSEKVRSRV